MKHILVFAAVFATLFNCFAQAGLLVGKFGHQFTNPKNTPVWDIRKRRDQYQLVNLSEPEETQKSHEFAESERRKFWQSMWWPEAGSSSAACVGNSQEVICYVPPKVRGPIGDLKNYKSDYFHFDSIGGLMEIEKLSK